MHRLIALLLGIFLSVSVPASATALTGGWPSAEEVMGFMRDNGSGACGTLSLSEDGQVALLGGSGKTSDPRISFYRRAAIFHLSSAGFERWPDLIPVGGHTARYAYGIALSGDGRTAVVSDLSLAEVYVFSLGDTGWVQQATLSTLDTNTDGRFGAALALSEDGTTLLVGVPSDDLAPLIPVNGGAYTQEKGSVHVFTRTGTTWTHSSRITLADSQEGDVFGFSLALTRDGMTAYIGTPRGYFDTVGTGGSVYVYTRVGTEWQQRAEIHRQKELQPDSFGSSLRLSSDGRSLLIGSLTDYYPTVSLFVRSHGIWTEQLRTIDRSPRLPQSDVPWSSSDPAKSTYALRDQLCKEVSAPFTEAELQEHELSRPDWD